MVVEFTCEGCGETTQLMPSVKRFACGCNSSQGMIQRPAVVHGSHWLTLHWYAADHSRDWCEADAREFYRDWNNRIPSFGCRKCLANWNAYTAANPPDFTSAKACAQWGFDAHNHVSEHHAGNPVMPIEDCWLTYWPKPRGYCDPHFVAVTSLAPRECPRQTAALDSWIDFGLTVHAVNTAAEIETLRPLYPQVDHWHPCEDQAEGLSKRTAKIKSLANIAIELDRTILLINSDCETYGSPSVLVDRLADRTLIMGIRHNYSDTWREAEREVWGLDAFVITPEMAASLPSLAFGIGIPVWDYWIPFHFLRDGYEIMIPEERWLFHKSHPLGWSQDDWLAGAAMLESHYGYSMREGCSEFRKSLPFPPETTE